MGRGAMDGVSPASQIVFLEKKVAELEAQLVEKEITIDQLTVTANTWNRKYDDECILTAHLQAQLPEGMQDCTIIFKECEVGHGWLTAKNWKQFDCPTCRIAELEAQLAELGGFFPVCGEIQCTKFHKKLQAILK